MAISKLDFARGQVVNPLSTFGDDLQKFGINLRQQELDRLAAERQANADKRAQEQLDLQKQQYADQQAAKAAGAEYLNAMKQAKDKALTPTQDALIDDKILNGPSSPQGLSAAEVAAFKSELAAAQEATRKDPKAMIDILNSVVVPKDIDANLASTVLDRSIKPYQDEAHQNIVHKNALEVAKQQHKDRLALEAVSHSNHNSRLEKEYNLKFDNTSFISEDPVTGKREVILGKDLRQRTPEEQKKFTTLQAYTDIGTMDITGNKTKHATVGVSMDDDGNYVYTKDGETPRLTLPVDEASKLVGKAKSTGGSGGTAGSNKSKSDVLSSITTDLAPKFDLFGKGDGKELIENSAAALALGVPPSIVKQLAERASFEGSGWLGNREASTSYYNSTDLTVVTKEGDHVKLGDAIEAAKLKGVDVTAKGFTLSKNDLKKSANNSTANEIVDRSGIPAPVKTKGLEMGPSLLDIYDKKVNEFKDVPNKALARSELYPIRQAIGLSEFERRYPGLASRLNLFYLDTKDIDSSKTTNPKDLANID